MRKIPFSPPDITEKEIQAVIDVLRSGWITSGPQLTKFEEGIKEYCDVNNALALNSATAAMELVLKYFDIKEGDEIITTPYTYTATSSVAIHRGIKPIYVDVKKDTFQMDIDKVAEKITTKKKKKKVTNPRLKDKADVTEGQISSSINFLVSILEKSLIWTSNIFTL